MNSFIKFQVNDILNINANFTDIRVLHELLKKGLKVNESIDKYGSTPLHLAAGIYEEQISLLAVGALLKHSANPNYPDKEGKTSVHVAALLGHEKVLQLLIFNGGNVLQSNLNGDTSIDLANQMEQYDVVSYLCFLLNTEEYEIPKQPSFVSFLLNRQLLEVTEDLSLKHPSITSSYIMYSQDLSTENDSDDNSYSYQNDFDESSYQSSYESFKDQQSRNDSRKLLEYYYHQTSVLTTCLYNETLEDYHSKTSLLDDGFVQPNDDYSQNLFDSVMNDSQLLSSINQCNKSSTQEYFTPFSSLNQTRELDSFLTVVENYVYKDEEEGIELIERRFDSSLLFSRSQLDQTLFYTQSEIQTNSKSIQQEESLETITSSIKNLSGKALRNKLKELGFDAGPVTSTTVRALQKYYQRLRCKRNVMLCEDLNTARRYSKELERFCNIFESSKNIYEDLEDKMCEPFLNPDPIAWWRNGIHKTCFNYLLLDPRITKNIALRPRFPVSLEDFRTFLSAIFYIGKGSKTRPYSHLYDSLKESSKYSENRKLRQIKEIWEDDLGVVSLHVFQCTIPVEAWTREACMISAYGLHNLTNSVQGSFYGPASTWRKTDQRKLGSFLLYQAFHIYLFEGERQIRPKDLPCPTWKC